MMLGLAVLLVGLAPATRAAAQKPGKSTAAPKSAKASRKDVIAREPYLGAIVVDAASGKVLFEDHADARGYPASVLKLMDLLIILEKVERKRAGE